MTDKNKQLYQEGKLIYMYNGKVTGVFYCNEEGKLCPFILEGYNDMFKLNENGYIEGSPLWVHHKIGYKLGLYNGGDYPPYQEIFFN